MSFTHLHLHTEFSLLDGLIKIDSLIPRVKDLGMNAVAMTDHGAMYGLWNFYSACKEAEVKPIIGCEMYVANRTRHDKVAKIDKPDKHIVLLAKDYEGYKNLIKLVSLGHLEGHYYKPRIDRELFEKYSKGLIALSACLSGVVNKEIGNNRYDKALEEAKYYRDLFGKENFFIELQRNGVEGVEGRNEQLVKIARKFDLPIVATCDSHYLDKEDWYVQEILWAIRDGKKMSDDDREKAWSEEFYLKSPEEMIKLFKDLPEAIENTQKITEMIEDFDVAYDRVQPKYPDVPKGMSAKELLKKKAFEGAKERYGKITKKIEERLNYELRLIHEKGYDDYFLVVHDFVVWAKDRGILVGPARGSGGGSVVAFCLKITDTDPIEYDLYFERFLNPERESPPDFDIDFQDDRRDEIFKYVEKKYGADNTCYIGTFGRLKTRAAIRDVARVMGINLEVADKLSKMVTVRFGRVTQIKDMMEDEADFKAVIDSAPELQQLAKTVEKIEGLPRHISTHACGFLITPKPIIDYVPVRRESKGGSEVITQIEGYPLEPMGLMKFDFLGLTNLTIIQNVLKLIKQNTGENIDVYEIPFDDKETYRLFHRGETTAIFQFESEGMKKYLKELQPKKLEDLMFLNSAYRPGPLQYIPDYIERKHGRQKPAYPHPDLKPILEETFGFAIYQEQVLKIAVDFAGYTLGEADMLRRAMGKKKREIMAKEKVKFIEGCKKKGYSKKLAEKVFAYLEPFADYGFNRPHAIAYAMIAYWTAYLKAHYPVEFMAGLMETEVENADRIKRDVEECERMRIEILSPDVNKSNAGFTIEGENRIRFGLAAVKNVGKKAAQLIVEARGDKPFASLDDLCERIAHAKLSKKPLEYLIRVGALDQFGERNALLQTLPMVMDRTQRAAANLSQGQVGLFDDMGKKQRQATVTPLVDVEKMDDTEKLKWEKELLGTYISTHPLDQYDAVLEDQDVMKISDLGMKMSGTGVKIGGIMNSFKRIYTKRDNKPMAFLEIEDKSGKVECVLFTNQYDKYKDELEESAIYVIEGSVSTRNDSRSVLVNKLTKIAEEDMKNAKIALKERGGTATDIVLDLTKAKDKEELSSLKQVFVNNPGDSRVKIIYVNGNGDAEEKSLKVGIELTNEVEEVIGPYRRVE